MQEGWECKKCHNVYSPNTPFCLYCWFQNQKKSEINIPDAISIDTNTDKQLIITDTLLNNNLNEKNITIAEKVEKASKETVNIRSINNSDIYTNKNLDLDFINISIPVLNKQPNFPKSERFPDTKIYLGGIAHSKERAINRKFRIPYVLDSIIDLPIRPSELVRKYFDYLKLNNTEYLLDSGAFSYMNNPKKSFDLKSHIQKYCFYINEFDIKDFIELDLDVFMNLDEIENIRRKIYLETHKQPIIVYHPERGYDYWINMCKENEFIAIGGLVVDKETNTPERQKRLFDMCEEAHMYGTRVHGLGFTPLSLLNSHSMFFDTVDSTTWNATKRGSSVMLNEKGEIIKIAPIPAFSAMESQEKDLEVWAKFSENYRGAYK